MQTVALATFSCYTLLGDLMRKSFNIQDFAKDLATHCSQTQIRKFKKDEVITTYLINRNQICILLSGEAYLVRYDSKGFKNIIDCFKTDDVFGEAFYRIHTNRELFVLAKTDCEVLFFSYAMQELCDKNCSFHETLVKSLPDLIFSRVIALNTRIELLSKRGIRDKLLSYFSILASQRIGNTFELPFSLTDLADYLIIDRAAMMREIKKLKEDKIIEKNGKKITLLCK